MGREALVDPQDSGWRFDCGEPHPAEDLKVVSLQNALTRGAGVSEAMRLPAMALPEGYYAWRASDDAAWGVWALEAERPEA